MTLIEETQEILLEGKSLNLFEPFNPLRKRLSMIVINKYFELFIFVNVIVSSIFLVLESPLEDPELPLF